MSSLLFHLYILLAILVLYNLYTHIAIFLLPVSSVFPTQTLGAGATPYKFLMFTQQWPKAVNKRRGLPYFTIHGLWPSNGSTVLNCTGRKFDRSQMPPDLEKKLNISWPDVERGRNWGFWEQEYNKHGTCCEDTFQYNQTKYFERADEMWRNLNIAQMLNKSGIVPGKNYTTSQVVAAIKKENQNKSPSIRCKNGSTGSEVLLLEVAVCHDHYGKKVINCRHNMSSSCRSQKQNISYVW